MASERPVLDAVRSLLKFKDFTTIAEIATIAGLSRRRVLDVVNANRFYIWKIPSQGRITRVDPRAILTEQLWKSGKFYREDTYGAFSVEGHCLTFEGNAPLRDRLQEGRTVGALGDNYVTKIVIDTPANRKALEDAGLRPWSEAVIDDRLWEETS